MMNKHVIQKPGYILILTIMVVALSVVVVTYITNKSTAYSPFAQAMVDRQKAMQLALGGVQIAMSQLVGEPSQTEKDPTAQTGQDTADTPQDKDAAAVSLLKTVLPVMNRWQTFALKRNADGIDGTIKVCLMCEHGKIDINALYDFGKQQFITVGTVNGQQLLKAFFETLEKALGSKDLFQSFEKFLKDRQYKLHDVTELLTIKEFEVFKRNIWYEPLDQKEAQKNKEKPSIYLTDIFTVWSEQPLLEPWLLSDSLCGLGGLKRAETPRESEKITSLVKQFKRQQDWKVAWDAQLASLYSKTYKDLQGIEMFFNTTFDPKIFSVLSYGKVGKIIQKVMAIIERGDVSKDGIHDVTIKKLYWI